jgi:hypothetical protein
MLQRAFNTLQVRFDRVWAPCTSWEIFCRHLYLAWSLSFSPMPKEQPSSRRWAPEHRLDFRTLSDYISSSSFFETFCSLSLQHLTSFVRDRSTPAPWTKDSPIASTAPRTSLTMESSLARRPEQWRTEMQWLGWAKSNFLRLGTSTASEKQYLTDFCSVTSASSPSSGLL